MKSSYTIIVEKNIHNPENKKTILLRLSPHENREIGTITQDGRSLVFEHASTSSIGGLADEIGLPAFQQLVETISDAIITQKLPSENTDALMGTWLFSASFDAKHRIITNTKKIHKQ